MKRANENLSLFISRISLIDFSAKHSRELSVLPHLLFDPGISCHFFHSKKVPSVFGTSLDFLHST